MVPRSLLCSFLLAVIFMVGGCWDYTELETQAFVMAIGIDTEDNEEFKVSLLIARTVNTPSGGSGLAAADVGKTTLFTSVEVPANLVAGQLVNSYLGRLVTLKHVRFLAVGEEAARKGGLAFMTSVARFRELRRNISVVVTRGTAEDFLRHAIPQMESNVAVYFDDLRLTQAATGMIPKQTLHAFLNDGSSFDQAPITFLGSTSHLYPSANLQGKNVGEELPGEIPRGGEGTKIELLGSGVINNGVLVGMLDGEETRIMNFVRNELKGATISFPDPSGGNFRLALIIQQATSHIEIKELEPVPHIQVSLRVEGSLGAAPPGTNYSDGHDLKKLEEPFGSYLQSEIEKLIRKAQELETDIFGFGQRARMKFRTWDAWEAYSWPSRFPEAEVEVQATFALRRTGLLVASPPNDN